MRRLAPALAIAAIAAAGLIWWLARDTALQRLPSPRTRPEVPALDRRSEPPAPESKPLDRKITPMASAESRNAEATSTPAIATATMRGRCVDAATKAPLAGCRAELRGAIADPGRRDEWVRRNGPVEWKDPPAVVTGDDGGFEVSFAPPPPYRFFLSLDRAGYAAMDGRWNAIAPGAVLDLGDIAMPPGTLVKGRILDEGGAPCPKVSFSLGAASGRRASMGKVAARQDFIEWTRADGTFVFERPFLAGTYEIGVRDAGEVLTPQSKSITIVEGEIERSLEVKLRVPLDTEAILGFVRDDLGDPVRGADVEINPANFSPEGRGILITSDQDGAFRIQRADPAYQGTPSISAKRTGYEPSAATRCEWGAKDVVLVLRRGLTVQIVVRDGDENKPLERYGVRSLQLPRLARRHPGMRKGSVSVGPDHDPQAGRLRERGVHKDGVLELGGVTRGRQLLLVAPEGREWSSSAFREFEMTESGAPPRRSPSGAT